MKGRIEAAFMVPHPPMIVPDIGKGSEKQVEKTIESYQIVAKQIAEIKPDTIIISSPHTVMYADYFHISPGKMAEGSFASFRAPNVCFKAEYDTELVQRIEELSVSEGVSAGTFGEKDKKLDHGTMVPLYFINKVYTDYRLIRVGLSGLDLTEHYRLGMLIRQAVEDTGRRAVYVASGDLSHKLQTYGPYGFSPEGPVYDERIMDICGLGAFGELFDFDEEFLEKAAECGHRSFVMMAGALDGLSVESTALSHEDVTGVGYGICSFMVNNSEDNNKNQQTDNKLLTKNKQSVNNNQQTDNNRHFLDIYLQQKANRLKQRKGSADCYVRLAVNTIESYITNNKKPSAKELLSGFSETEVNELILTRAGAFVSIHEHGRLRGCIGTIAPVRESIAEEIISNAISASTKDPRFEPIEESELPYLDVSVDILGEPKVIESKDELDVKRYGVIVSCGSKRGLLLPDLDGVDTVEDQISIAMKKGGIRHWEDYTLERFEVVRHEM